jgi:hypothetical protein
VPPLALRSFIGFKRRVSGFSYIMASKRAKSNRGRFMGRRRAKPVTLNGHMEITQVADPKASCDAAWRFLDLETDLDFSRNQRPKPV